MKDQKEISITPILVESALRLKANKNLDGESMGAVQSRLESAIFTDFVNHISTYIEEVPDLEIRLTDEETCPEIDFIIKTETDMLSFGFTIVISTVLNGLLLGEVLTEDDQFRLEFTEVDKCCGCES